MHNKTTYITTNYSIDLTNYIHHLFLLFIVNLFILGTNVDVLYGWSHSLNARLKYKIEMMFYGNPPSNTQLSTEY